MQNIEKQRDSAIPLDDAVLESVSGGASQATVDTAGASVGIAARRCRTCGKNMEFVNGKFVCKTCGK